MISLTRLNGKKITVNALLIESIEETPDTMITLTTGKKITVLENLDTTIGLIREYMKDIGAVRASVQSLRTEEF